jgi:hypothetical protein
METADVKMVPVVLLTSQMMRNETLDIFRAIYQEEELPKIHHVFPFKIMIHV